MEKERERNINVWLPFTHPHPYTRDLAHTPGMCPDWELNPQPFGSQAHAQSTEPPQLGQVFFHNTIVQSHNQNIKIDTGKVFVQVFRGCT